MSRILHSLSIVLTFNKDGLSHKIFNNYLSVSDFIRNTLNSKSSLKAHHTVLFTGEKTVGYRPYRSHTHKRN